MGLLPCLLRTLAYWHCLEHPIRDTFCITHLSHLILTGEPLKYCATVVITPQEIMNPSVYLFSNQRMCTFSAKSPVFSHVKASYDGLTTIRACEAQNYYINEFDMLQVNYFYKKLNFFSKILLFFNSRMSTHPHGI